jgi:transposase-like protein
MAEGNGSERVGLVQAVLLDDPDFLRGIVERTVQAILDEEMTAHRPGGTRGGARRTW